ncbi:hypothetical protein VTJ04DRAFT_2875 [Mycothermus thermophilus]|uniref:uncharacterized protein n=1 Tax=Humicola insolens TaxID=85995 RepID=UPI00374330EA
MPSARRYRVLTYLLVASIVTLLFFVSKSRDQVSHYGTPGATNDFYSKTVHALDKEKHNSHHHHHPHGHPGSDPANGQKPVVEDGDDDDELARGVADRLKQAEKDAKESAEAKGPKQPQTQQEVVGVGNAAGGKDKADVADAKGEAKDKEEQRDTEVEGVLRDIMKKSPIIIFSKSYCPYSKAAKGILLEKYTIEPAPYVVELDKHPLGVRIQDRLGEMTGRRTVPNVMVYGQSIGGGDEVAAMDRMKTLADKIQSIADDRIKVSLRFEQTAQKSS